MAERNRLTEVRAKYAAAAIFERPFFVDERSWSMFTAHVWHGKSFQEIAVDIGASQHRVRQIVRRVAYDLELPRGDGWSNLTDSSPLEDLALSIRARNALHEVGCRTVGDVLRLDLSGSVPRLGPASRRELALALAHFGFTHPHLCEPADTDLVNVSRTLHQLKAQIASCLRTWEHQMDGIESRLRKLLGT
jgi:hypothetical protein